MARSKQVQRVVESLKNSPEDWVLKDTLFSDQLVNDKIVIDTEYLRIFISECTVYKGNNLFDNTKLKKAVMEFIDNYE